MKRLVIPVLATVLMVALMAFQARTVEPEVCAAPVVRLGEIPGYVSEVDEASEAERYTLPADTQIVRRRYTGSDGRWFVVSVIIGGRSKSSIHRPEMCLPSQGFQMRDPRTRAVADVDWRLVTLEKDRYRLGYAYTFFNQEGFRTVSHLLRIFRDVWDRSICGRIDRWVMVTVSASTPDDVRVLEFLRHLKGLFP